MCSIVRLPYCKICWSVSTCWAELVRGHHWLIEHWVDLVVAVWIFTTTRHPWDIEAMVIVMYMYLYSIAFIDHPCTLGALSVTKRHPVHYTQPRACRVWTRLTNGMKICLHPSRIWIHDIPLESGVWIYVFNNDTEYDNKGNYNSLFANYNQCVCWLTLSQLFVIIRPDRREKSITGMRYFFWS